ncbi:cytochrome c-type biogenesis protein [Idiomarina sp. HP20-50]|uniref:cytochrome c-type biogenesis protein n=1 Tax=Idiomarina sp. HP20-50 TaxID=3070813 RepID=UPI00294AC6E7|nr:cytochrome c-type biogenesis protein [Idiomarina sp. HP20-50]MDV6316928.1 cytochrome c-type biogenesis protein CcmH [Idiomarina sp. HP20-50]
MRTVLLALATVLVMVSAVSAKNENSYEFDSEQQRETYQQLVKELRCPKCQNQNIADSNAPLAEDMRDRTYEMLREGQSREDIIRYMVARYGNFVHYRPPITAATSILWWAPLLVLFMGIAVAVILTRKKKAAVELTQEERARLEQLRKSGDE